ncbi:FIG00613761: hypothetical protein [hydrothermal vent metagenome]|uniref:Phage tail protein n=1 Tax=hydrothermal vent metagenome TaxID=652676 RepID=A0A3B1D4W7_9ZZZZ
MPSSDLYPLPAFYFKVVFPASMGTSDTSFQEVSGIASEIETDALVEGGENRFVHKLPKSIKHPNMVLKRGIAKKNSPLVLWCKKVLDGDFVEKISPVLIMVYLMNELKKPVRGWSFDNAYPVKWEVDPFNSTKNEVAIEKIELSYNTLERTD